MDIKEMGERANPARGASTVALEHYHDILAARRHLWRWVDIAGALGFANANALNKAFLRVSRGVDKGRLKPAGGHTQRAGGNGRSRILDNSSSSQQRKGTVIDLDDPANQ
jgi:hypothetical protein